MLCTFNLIMYYLIFYHYLCLLIPFKNLFLVLAKANISFIILIHKGLVKLVLRVTDYNGLIPRQLKSLMAHFSFSCISLYKQKLSKNIFKGPVGLLSWYRSTWYWSNRPTIKTTSVRVCYMSMQICCVGYSCTIF